MQFATLITAASIAACFNGPRPAYLVTLAQSGFTPAELGKALSVSCGDFKQTQVHGKKRLGYVFADAYERTFAESLAQAIPTMLADVFDSSGVVKEYER